MDEPQPAASEQWMKSIEWNSIKAMTPTSKNHSLGTGRHPFFIHISNNSSQRFNIQTQYRQYRQMTTEGKKDLLLSINVEKKISIKKIY